MLSVRMVMVPATALGSQQIIHLEVLLDYICLHPDEIAFMAEKLQHQQRDTPSWSGFTLC